MNEPRRIFTRIVIDMTQDDLPTIESEGYLYDGPVDLCMPSDGAGGRSGGDGDRGSGGSSESDSGDSDGMGGFGGYGGLGIGNPGSYGGKNDPGRTSEGGYSKSGGGSNFGGLAGSARSVGLDIGLNTVADAIAGYAQRPGKSDTGYYGNDPDMTAQIADLTGQQVSRTPQGYHTADDTRMAYSSGNPTSYGAQATAREHDLGMSWNGSKAMNEAASDARATARTARAREIQAKATAALKDPVALGIDPHMAKAAYDDAMHGMYDKAVAVGAMSPAEAQAVREAYGGVAGAFGIGLDDVTTPYESFVDSVAQGLVDPVTGKLTTKGWANVAAPALGMLAGPLSMIGLSVAGIPGAIAGALAPSAINAAAAPKKNAGVETAVGLAGKVTGVDMSPIGAGLAYADTMNTMSRAQGYAGTQPDSASSADGQRDGGDGSFLQGMAQFFTKKAGQKQDGTNPRFKQRSDSRFAGREQGAQEPVRQQATKQSIIGPEFLAGFKPFFRRA